MKNITNAMCVIPADGAAKEDLEGSELQRGKMKRGINQEPHGLGKTIACGACRGAE
jgi:hypothetical protein